MVTLVRNNIVNLYDDNLKVIITMDFFYHFHSYDFANNNVMLL